MESINDTIMAPPQPLKRCLRGKKKIGAGLIVQKPFLCSFLYFSFLFVCFSLLSHTYPFPSLHTTTHTTIFPHITMVKWHPTPPILISRMHSEDFHYLWSMETYPIQEANDQPFTPKKKIGQRSFHCKGACRAQATLCGARQQPGRPPQHRGAAQAHKVLGREGHRGRDRFCDPELRHGWRRRPERERVPGSHVQPP